MMTTVALGVFLLDDHELVRTGLRALLEGCHGGVASCSGRDRIS